MAELIDPVTGQSFGFACGPDDVGISDDDRKVIEDFAEHLRIGYPAKQSLGGCCELHNEHCEPPSELCCGSCTEYHHGLHACPGRLGTSHDDGSRCVLE